MERLDGNAVAGTLGELLAVECTEVRVRCDSCGVVGSLGGTHAYAGPLAPGAVLRCVACEAILAVVVRSGERTRFAFRGMTWLEVLERP